MKKRSCRRTEQESNIHDQAVRLRKMTDSQLVEEFSKKYSAGYEKGLTEAKATPQDGMSAEELLDKLKNGTIRGIGKVTIKKIEDLVYA